MVIDDQEIILDTDLGKLQGIVSSKVPQSVLDTNGKGSIGEINPIAPWETISPRASAVIPSTSQQNDATWTAPESWGVRPHNSITEDFPELPEDNGVIESRQTYCLRVFRVTELLGLLAKKFFVPAGERWVLVHYTNNLARVMQPSERPVTVQQKSLERLGYVEDLDGGGEMGRDDWSGFWRFVFMRTDGLSSTAVSSYCFACLIEPGRSSHRSIPECQPRLKESPNDSTCPLSSCVRDSNTQYITQHVT